MFGVWDDSPSPLPIHAFDTQARTMVSQQLEARDIHDVRILSAMRRLPRHRFVPNVDPKDAYQDRPLPTGSGQTISQPYITAWMTQWLNVGAGQSVLEVGTGSGYQTALLVLLGVRVITIERHPELSAAATATLTELGLARRVRFVVADGSLGHVDAAPYDRILVTAAAPRFPASLQRQLAVGGMAVAPLGERGQQQLTRISGSGKEVSCEMGLRCRFVPLVGDDAWSPS